MTNFSVWVFIYFPWQYQPIEADRQGLRLRM